MIKVNREKSIRIGIATMALPIVMGMSGCSMSQKNKVITKDQEERMVEYNAVMDRLGSLIDLDSEINKKNVVDDYRQVDGLIYNNYPVSDAKEKKAYNTVGDINKKLSEFDKLSYQNKIEYISYLNSVVNNYYLDSAFEGLYREILITSCSIGYNDLLNPEDMLYIEDGKAMIESSNKNSIEVLMNYYGIGADEASWLLELIRIKPNNQELLEKMEKDSEFGKEDFIPAHLKNLKDVIDVYMNIEKQFNEYYKNNSMIKKRK